MNRKKNGADVSAEPSLTGRYQILQHESKFIIDRALEVDAGNYTCTLKDTGASASIRVIGEIRFDVRRDNFWRQ